MPLDPIPTPRAAFEEMITKLTYIDSQLQLVGPNITYEQAGYILEARTTAIAGIAAINTLLAIT